MREYKLELLALAWQELEAIADMHLSLVRAKSAEKITTKILDALEHLKTSPFMGRACEERILAVDEYRKLIVDKYLCFYRVIADAVYVYHIANGKRD